MTAIEQFAYTFSTVRPQDPGSAIIITLYELIETINEEVKPEEDKLVSEIVLDMLYSEQIKFVDNLDEFLGHRWV